MALRVDFKSQLRSPGLLEPRVDNSIRHGLETGNVFERLRQLRQSASHLPRLVSRSEIWQVVQVWGVDECITCPPQHLKVVMGGWRV